MYGCCSNFVVVVVEEEAINKKKHIEFIKHIPRTETEKKKNTKRGEVKVH